MTAKTIRVESMNRKKWTRILILTAPTAFIAYFLFAKPLVCAAGVQSGLSLCARVIVPSLFPFMVLSSFLLKSGLGAILSAPFNGICKALFRLPGICAPVIFMSMVGGYPIGPKMTAELLRTKQLTKGQAQRMNLFCINAGPAFTIGTVGAVLLGSVKAGVLLYVSAVCASLLTGVLSVAAEKEKPPPSAALTLPALRDPVQAFVDATAGSVLSVLTVCAWVILFRTLGEIVASLPLSDGFKLFFSCVSEVANGCQSAAGELPAPALAAIISFGGLSVHCQVLSDVRESGLGAKYFYTARVVCASLSAILCMELLKVFPCEIQVFSTTAELTAAPYSLSASACAVLLIMSALLIFEVEPGGKV